MTTPNDLDGMPIVYSAIFTAIEGNVNPVLEPNHPWADSNSLRVRVPKGVSTVQVSTSYVGSYIVVHQETINGAPVNIYHRNMNGSGVFQVRALAEGSTLFVSTPTMTNSTDNWGFLITNFPPGTV